MRPRAATRVTEGHPHRLDGYHHWAFGKLFDACMAIQTARVTVGRAQRSFGTCKHNRRKTKYGGKKIVSIHGQPPE